MWPSPRTPTAERESSYAAPIPTGCDRRGSDPVGNSALLTSICLIRGNLPAGTFRAMTDGWQVAEAIRVVVGALGTAATAGISLYLIGLERKDRRRDARERKEAQAAATPLTFNLSVAADPPRTADSRQAYGGSDAAGGARYILTGSRGAHQHMVRRRPSFQPAGPCRHAP